MVGYADGESTLRDRGDAASACRVLLSGSLGESEADRLVRGDAASAYRVMLCESEKVREWLTLRSCEEEL